MVSRDLVHPLPATNIISCQEYPVDIGYPAPFVPTSDDIDVGWLVQCSPEVPGDRAGADYLGGNGFAEEYETSPTSFHGDTPKEMQKFWERDPSKPWNGVPTKTDSLWSQRCSSTGSAARYVVALDEEQQRILDGINRKCQSDLYPCASRVHEDHTMKSHVTALPSPEEHYFFENTTPCIGRYPAKSGDQQMEDAQSCANSPHPVKVPKKKDRTRHNVVEQRYRENLNTRIIQLRDRIPNLQAQANAADDDEQRKTKRGSIGKATVLLEAGEYIEQLQAETVRLRKQNDALEKLVKRLVMALEGESKVTGEMPTRISTMGHGSQIYQ